MNDLMRLINKQQLQAGVNRNMGPHQWVELGKQTCWWTMTKCLVIQNNTPTQILADMFSGF